MSRLLLLLLLPPPQLLLLHLLYLCGLLLDQVSLLLLLPQLCELSLLPLKKEPAHPSSFSVQKNGRNLVD